MSYNGENEYYVQSLRSNFLCLNLDVHKSCASAIKILI